MRKVTSAIMKGVAVQVAALVLFAITAPFVGQVGLLLMPALLFLIPEDYSPPNLALRVLAALVLDVLLYAALILAFSAWAQRRRASKEAISILK
jgi:hypothetical protein